MTHTAWVDTLHDIAADATAPQLRAVKAFVNAARELCRTLGDEPAAREVVARTGDQFGAVDEELGAMWRECAALLLARVDVETSALRRERDAVLQLSSLLETAPDAMVVVDASGRMVLVNRQTERLFGYTRDELIGTQVERLMPARFREAHPTHREIYAAAPRPRGMGAGLELYGLRKDGSEFPIEISLSPTTTSGGLLVSSAIRDLTERKRAEAKLRNFLEAAPDAILIADTTGRIEAVNAQAEKLFGYDRSELVGTTIERLIPERYRAEHPRHRAHYAVMPKVRAMGSGLELYGLRKDSSQFPVEVSLSPLETGEETLVACAVRDISERKAIEMALKLANRELESFSYSVAHDLRAPLRGMSGFARILLDSYRDQLDADGKDFLAEIVANAKQMADLIDALLSLSRVSLSDLRVEHVDLAVLARTCLDHLAAREPGRSVQLEVPPLLAAELDPRLAQVLIENLIGNAWKYTAGRDPARIQLGVELRPEARVYFVRDNGAGFDPRFIDKLFVPFQRLHAAREFAGTGVGLAIVQRIVHRHGGRIWAEGAVDQGATFRFTLTRDGLGVAP